MVNRRASLAFLSLLDALDDVAGVGVQSFKRLRPRSFLARFWPAADLPPWYEQSNQQQLVHQLQQRQQGVDADFPTELQQVDVEDSSTSGGISDSEASRSVLFHTLSGRTVAVPSGSTGVEAKEFVAKALGIDEVRQRLSLQLTTSSSSTASSEGEKLEQVQICDSDVLDIVAVADFGERGPGERHDVTLTRLQRSRPTEPERRIAKAATVTLFRAPEGETRGTVVVQKRTLLLTGSTNRTARLWDVDRCRLLQTFEGHTQSVGKTWFLPSCGSSCDEVGGDGPAPIDSVNNATSEMDPPATTTAGSSASDTITPSAGLAPGPGGSRLGVLRVATQAWNGTTRVWNAKTGQCEMLLDSRFWLDEGSVNPESYWTRTLSDDGKIMLTVSDAESHLVAWDISPGNDCPKFYRRSESGSCCNGDRRKKSRVNFRSSNSTQTGGGSGSAGKSTDNSTISSCSPHTNRIIQVFDTSLALMCPRPFAGITLFGLGGRGRQHRGSGTPSTDQLDDLQPQLHRLPAMVYAIDEEMRVFAWNFTTGCLLQKLCAGEVEVDVWPVTLAMQNLTLAAGGIEAAQIARRSSQPPYWWSDAEDAQGRGIEEGSEAEAAVFFAPPQSEWREPDEDVDHVEGHHFTVHESSESDATREDMLSDEEEEEVAQHQKVKEVFQQEQQDVEDHANNTNGAQGEDTSAARRRRLARQQRACDASCLHNLVAEVFKKRQSAASSSAGGAEPVLEDGSSPLSPLHPDCFLDHDVQDCRYFSGCDETLLLTTSNKAAAIWNTESGKLVAAVELRLRTNNSTQSGSDHARRGAQQRAENDRPDAREAPKAGEDVGGTDGKNKKLILDGSGSCEWAAWWKEHLQSLDNAMIAGGCFSSCGTKCLLQLLVVSPSATKFKVGSQNNAEMITWNFRRGSSVGSSSSSRAEDDRMHTRGVLDVSTAPSFTRAHMTPRGRHLELKIPTRKQPEILEQQAGTDRTVGSVVPPGVVVDQGLGGEGEDEERMVGEAPATPARGREQAQAEAEAQPPDYLLDQVYRASGTTLRALSPHGTRALFQLEGDARSRSGSSSNRGSLLCITTPSSAPPSCSGIVGGGGQESMRRGEEVVGRGAEELHRRPRASTLSPEEPIVLEAPEDTWYKRTVGWVQVAGFANDYIVAQPQLSRRLLVWDATTGEFHGYLDGHQDRVNTMACL